MILSLFKFVPIIITIYIMQHHINVQVLGRPGIHLMNLCVLSPNLRNVNPRQPTCSFSIYCLLLLILLHSASPAAPNLWDKGLSVDFWWVLWYTVLQIFALIIMPGRNKAFWRFIFFLISYVNNDLDGLAN